METKRIGNTAEAKVLAKCIEKGWTVLLPFGDIEPYDLVIDRGNGFEKVQVKNAHLNSDRKSITFNAYSLSGRTHNQIATDYIGKADLFGVYFPELDEVYLVPVGNYTTKVSLRLEKAQRDYLRIRYAKDFLVA